MPNESAVPIHGERLNGLTVERSSILRVRRCGLLLRPLWMRGTAPFRLQLLKRALPARWDLCRAERIDPTAMLRSR